MTPPRGVPHDFCRSPSSVPRWTQITFRIRFVDRVPGPSGPAVGTQHIFLVLLWAFSSRESRRPGNRTSPAELCIRPSHE